MVRPSIGRAIFGWYDNLGFSTLTLNHLFWPRMSLNSGSEVSNTAMQLKGNVSFCHNSALPESSKGLQMAGITRRLLV
jgi:hypothetical protein